MHVPDPSGRTWTITRRLIELPRWRGVGNLDSVSDFNACGLGDGLEGLVIGLLVVIALALTIVFVWPLALLVVEVVAALVLLAVRFILGRWTVRVETAGERRSWRVRGRAESVRFAAQLADVLRTGGALPVES